jgi:Domain of unknown function (DUF4389)
MSTPMYPVRLVGGHDLERSRLTVFFRILLVIPHAVVLALYAIAAYIVAIIAWFAALFTGSVPEGMHDFIAGFLRYYARVLAYGTILADPFPPFGPGGTYPVDLEIDPPVAQSRLTVFFRLILAIPCWFVTSILQYLLELLAIGNWIVALILGRVPNGMQTLGMFCLRFMTRTQSYIFLVNPRYPAFGDTPGSLPHDAAALPPLP